MIKTRLIQLLSHAKKYIVYQVIWKWLSLICQIIMISQAAMLLEDAFVGEVTEQKILSCGAIILTGILLRFLFDRQASYASYQASVDVKWILRKKIYEKLLRLGASYRESTATSEVVQMAAEGVEQLETYFGKYLSQLFYSLLSPVTLFAVLIFVNRKASIVLLICVPLIPLSIVAVQKIAKKLLNQYWGIYTELGDSFLENLQGLTTLKIYQADQDKADEMDRESQRFRQITMKVLTMQLNSTSVMDIIAYGGAGVGMLVALSEYSHGNVSLGGTLMIVLLASEFFIPLRLLGSFFHIAMNGMAASDKIFALLDLPEPKREGVELSSGKIDICMQGVQYSYSGREAEKGQKEEQQEVLKEISVRFPSGSFTSLVGTSGCGKSTIAGILMGRNRGYQGSVTVQGTELSEISEQSLMEQITLVTHNSYLFRGTVRENLLMGKPDASENELWEALEQVNLKGFLEAQQGLDTVVMEKGSNFSGGQCQRLALARALLHDTPVYIFDEATSNIDMESEEMIMRVIRKMAGTRTVLLISHRLANVVASDQICLMQEGRIVERGTQKELMEKNGAYAKLYCFQEELESYGKTETFTENQDTVYDIEQEGKAVTG
ncbi:MAG: ABC transporter ATP-binding protein/permease [Fusicatenibacter sp.]|nr:ABC transporter ATP-binding protein/permease [Fusicatenibacter sp.]